MALETGSYISDLVITNPTGADAKSTSDDHHRLIKKTVKQSFPNVSGAVTASHTELSYVAGVTSAIQTQINAKASNASPTFTGTVVLPASTSIGTVSAAEILTLDGISSNIQSQIDLKAPLANPTFTGAVTVPTPASSTDAASKGYADALSMASGNMPVGGTTGQFLKKNSATNYDTVWTNPSVTRVARSSNTILAAADSGSLFDLSGTFTQTLTAAATLGSGWFCTLRNTSNGTITIDPNGSELIDGLTTFSMLPGYTIQIICTGTAFTVLVLKARTYLNVAQYTAGGSFIVPADTYVIRGYAFGSGAAGTAGSNSGAGGGCAYGDIAVTPGQTVTLVISTGISAVQVSATAMLTANPGVGTAAGTASKDASVTNGGAFSGGAGNGSGGGGGSSGSPLGAGVAGVASGGGSGWGSAGVPGGGGGGVGTTANPNAAGNGLLAPSTDPLLFGLTGKGGMNGFPSGSDVGGTGSDGGGGGKGEGTSSIGGNGGFGAGGGAATSTSGIGGAGGFGGGGGGGAQQGGAGGFGGGGGTGSTTGGAAGAAVIRIYY